MRTGTTMPSPQKSRLSASCCQESTTGRWCCCTPHPVPTGKFWTNFSQSGRKWGTALKLWTAYLHNKTPVRFSDGGFRQKNVRLYGPDGLYGRAPPSVKKRKATGNPAAHAKRGKENEKDDLKLCIFIVPVKCEKYKWVNFKIVLSC